MALPPFFQTIWIDQELVEVEDPIQLARLNATYQPEAVGQGGRDFNLNPNRWRNLDRLVLPQLSDWSGLCNLARCRAEAPFRKSAHLNNCLEIATRPATKVISAILGQLKARANRSLNPLDEAEWALEHKLYDALISGIRDVNQRRKVSRQQRPKVSTCSARFRLFLTLLEAEARCRFRGYRSGE